ncbi:glycosyl transferase, group 1 family protein [Verrucomicrobiia bacterium DG1235]|nr:glycosyl transferase, group 1 family protein [Verrucomicrobiae bacterium DG1235]
MHPPLRIALIEPFFSGSHRRWAEELQRHSRHQIDLITLPGRHWKWRMHGAAVTLANQLLSRETEYDLILATDMLDFAVFLALVRSRYAHTPTAVYFHENQLCYPWSPRDADVKKSRDLHYAFINYTTALAADRVYYNSNYHREAFLSALPDFLDRYPDHQNKSTLESISTKSQALPLGLDLKAFDPYKPAQRKPNAVPLLLWNHRWEYDKNPKGFCKLLYKLLDRGIDFDVALLGDRFEEEPEYFREAREKLDHRIVAYGRADTFEDYAKWLWKADIIPVTSRQDFFGGSVVEAIYCGCHPILPNRLAYPDHVDAKRHPELYFENLEQAADKIEKLVTSENWESPCSLASDMARYDWSNCIERYDNTLSLA